MIKTQVSPFIIWDMGYRGMLLSHSSAAGVTAILFKLDKSATLWAKQAIEGIHYQRLFRIPTLVCEEIKLGQAR